MAETITCTGDCIRCSMAQRVYCAAQRCHAMLQNQQLILAQLAELREAISQARAVTPIDETGTEKDAGAENRASIKRRTSKKEKGNEL